MKNFYINFQISLRLPINDEVSKVFLSIGNRRLFNRYSLNIDLLVSIEEVEPEIRKLKF